MFKYGVKAIWLLRHNDFMKWVVEFVEEFGPAAKRPRVDTLKGSNHANMKELRFHTSGGVWRVAFAFDPRRRAILLIAGDKSGTSDSTCISSEPSLKIEVVMAHTLHQKIATLSPKRQAKVKARAAKLIAEELSLQDLRKAMNRTQAEVARVLNVGQDTVSRYEQRTDMLISTLQEYVEAMGGELDLIAKFPKRGTIKIKAFRDLSVSK
jgi:DNA-binding transcriptional regulator YiaG